MSVTVIYIAVA